MGSYKKDIAVSITKMLQESRDMGIKRSLDIVDVLEISSGQRKILRKAILEGFNDLYDISCKALTYVQEQ